MKRILIFILGLALMITGCAKPDVQTASQPQDTIVTDSIEPETTNEIDEEEYVRALLAVSVPATCEKYTHTNGDEIFSYTAQHMQLIHPNASVAEKVVLDFLNRVNTARINAESILAAAKNDYTDDGTWHPYSYQVLYSPTRIDYGVLSLYGVQNSFSGGMHGNRSSVAINYDLMTGDILTLGSIMHADAKKEDFINLVNDKLKAMKDEYQLYDHYKDGVTDRLGGDENLYEDFFFTSTGLNFFFSPYEIAPYSSGIITVEIPYSELPGLIYDGYFPEERQVINGKMLTSTFDISSAEMFNNMAEVNLAPEGSAYVIYPEGEVENIQVHVAGDMMNVPDYTVFAAHEMSGKDAVVINLTDDLISRISVSYAVNNDIITIPLSG